MPQLLHSPLLSSFKIPHAFTTRVGGISPPPFNSLNFGNPSDLPPDQRDPPANIAENFRLTLAALNAPSRRIIQVHQVHGHAVHTLRAPDPDHSSASSDTKADAIVTDDPARILAVRVADCTPILLASADARIVAAVHAGWRGLIAGVLPAAISAMRTLGAQNIHAAIGPCIGPNHFQVGPEVAAEFHRIFGAATPLVRPDPSNTNKSLVDLKSALAHQLHAADIHRIDILPHCTVEHAHLFFSHRRDHSQTGRMAALIGCNT